MKISNLLVSTALFASVLNAAPFTLDKTHSNASFKIKHLSVSKVVGSFKDFDAEIDADGEKINMLKASIKTMSVSTDNDGRDAHLQKADFFDSEKYPEMKFEMTGFKKDKIMGNLTIKDVTKPVTLSYDFGGKTMKNGKEHIGFSLEGEIKRTEFNFAPMHSEISLGDKVEISIEVEAVAK